MTDQERADLTDLLARPAFLRFLVALIQSAGVFDCATNGSDTRNLHFFEGRRSLGLDLLRRVEAAQPVPSPNAIPVMTMIACLREAAQPRKEKTRDRSIYDDDSDD